jgi:hypothetical protein
MFQGLISHSQATLETPRKRVVDEEESEGSRSDSEEGFHRIHVRVPLPSIGDVGVDIAQRSSEVLIRFTTSDDSKIHFIEKESERLAAIFRDQGYEKVEISTAITNITPNDPAWSEELQRRGIVA